MKRMRTCAWVLGLAAVLLLSAAVTIAQPQPTLPNENHYKVYQVQPPFNLAKPVGLVDQFGPIDVTSLVLEKFANPAVKIHPDGTVSPIVDDKVHLTWWRIYAPQPYRTVVGIDQFGTSQWTLKDALYLLNPAIKDPPATGGDPPVWNHYVCYDALGPVFAESVTLVDQWGHCNVVVVIGKLFCNPAEKRADGVVYPIIDSRAHLACYTVINYQPFARTYTARDQFGYWDQYAVQNDCLCVPALKEDVVKTQESTWGKIKAMYR